MNDLLVEKHGHTTVFIINRPDHLNAINNAVRSELTEGMAEFQADPNQYVAIITGSGDRAFCAGADLKEMAAATASASRLPMTSSPDPFGVAACEKVTIAANNGLTVAGGLELSICCDIRIASDHAWYALLEAKRGLLASIGVVTLPRIIPMGAVMDMLLSGDRLTAEEAYNFGLVQRVVPHEKLMDFALEKAEKISSNSQPAVWGAKQIIQFWRNAFINEQQKYYEAVMHRVLLSGDFLEGPRAFAEKREPNFSNRWPNPFEK